MPPKADPFASKLHRRVDAALLLITILIIALVVRASATGQTAPPRNNGAPDSFSSPLALFQTGYLAGVNYLALLRAPAWDGQTDSHAALIGDFSALAGLSGNSKSGFAPMLLTGEKSNTAVAPINLDLGNTRRFDGTTPSGPNLADNWFRSAGVGSTIPSYTVGFGLTASNASPTTPDSLPSEVIASAIERSPLYAGEPEHSRSNSSKAPISTLQQNISAENTGAASVAPATSTKARTSQSVAGLMAVGPMAPVGTAATDPTPDAIAALHTWNGGGGNVNWNTPGNWTGGAPPSSAATDLLFAGVTNPGTLAAPLNQNVANPMILNRITFDVTAGNFFLGGNAIAFLNTGANNTITQSSSNSQNIANNLTNGHTTSNPDIIITLAGNGSGLVTLSGVISDNSGGRQTGILKTGTSTFILTGTNTYTDTTTISAGALTITNSSALGTTAGGTSVATGAVLRLDGTAGDLSVGAEALTLNGTGLAAAPAGALRNIAGANSWAGLITLGSASTITASAGTLTLTGGITNGGFLTTFDGAGNTTVSTAAITGSGGLNKTGTGTLTLSGGNSYTGLTTVSQGVLNIQNNTALGTIANGTSVTSGAALQIQGGTITVGAEALTLNGTGISNTGALRNISGTNTWQGTVTLGSATRINSDAGSLPFNTAANSITGTNQSLTLGGAGNGTIAGTITTGTGTLTKDGAGTWTLSGAAANTFTGLTTASGGVLQLNKSSGNAIAGDLTIGDGVGTDTVTLLAANQIADTSVVTLTIGGSAVFNLNGNNETIGSLTDSAVGASGAAVQLGSGTLTFGDASSRTFGGVISGATGQLVKQGTGTQTLTGGSANTYTGLTTVSNGILALNKTAGINAIAGDGNTATNDVLINGGTLRWDASNQVADSASILMTSGAFSLNGFAETIFSFTNSGGTFTTGANGILHGSGGPITWSGGTNTVNNGGLVEDGHFILTGGTNTVNGGATGGVLQVSSGGAGLEMTGSTLTLDSSNSVAGSLLLQNNVTTFASATSSVIASGLALTNPGNINLDAGSRLFTVADGAAAIDLNISAVIANGSITKAGPGTMNLSGANTYNGTTLSAGTLRLSGVGTLGSTTGSLTVNGGTLDVNGTSQTVGALSGSGGMILNNGGATNLTVGNGGGSGSYSGTIANGSGVLGLVKTGAGTETLSGANSYTGATAVNAGTLLINGDQTAATGAVSVSNTGTTLGGIGSIGGAVTINPGANITGATDGTVGTLTMASLAFSGVSGNFATFIVDLIGATSDTLNITGLLDLSGLFDALSFNGTPDGTSSYTLAMFGSISGTFNSAPSFMGYQYIYGANTLVLSPLTPVPEPGTWAAGILTLLALGYTQRRRLARLLKANGKPGLA